MELLIGDRRIKNREAFPQPFPPFTAAADDNIVPSTLPVPPDDDFAAFRGFPPQKLRPIRGNPRSPSQVRNDNQLGHRHSNAMELDGTFDKLGVLVNEVCADAGGYFGLPPDAADCVGLGRSVAGGVKGQCLTRDCSPGDGSGSGRQKLNADGDDSSSSTGDDDSSASTKKGAGSKRKRKTREKLEEYVERLTMKVMEKQERLHTELMATLERKEKERIMREEAWKRQEIERMEREEAARAQEISHNIAFISFIKKAIGNNNGGEEIPQAQAAAISPVVDDQPKEGYSSPPVERKDSCDASSKKWPEAEVQALIKIRTSFEQKFRVMGYTSSYVWDEISARMQKMGYHRTGKNCRSKWENMNSYFKRSLGTGEKKRCDSSRLPYFNELERLYKDEVFSSSITPNQRTGKDSESGVKVNLRAT